MRDVAGWHESVQIESVVALAIAGDVVQPDSIAAEDILNTPTSAMLMGTVDCIQNLMSWDPSPPLLKLLEQVPNHRKLLRSSDDPRLIRLGGDRQGMGVGIKAHGRQLLFPASHRRPMHRT